MLCSFFVLNVFTDIVDGVKGIIIFFVNLWDLLVNFFNNAASFIRFIIDGVISTFTLMTNALNLFVNLYSYVPAYAAGFIAIFVSGLSINVIMEVV